MIVLLDTNALMMPVEFGIDVIEEVRRHIPNARFATARGVVNELRAIDNPAARVGLQLIKMHKIKVYEHTERHTDDALLAIARRLRGAVCTNDADLRRRCRAAGIPVLFMRKKRIIEVEGVIE